MTKEDLEIIQIEIDKAIAELFWCLTINYPETIRENTYLKLTSGKWRGK